MADVQYGHMVVKILKHHPPPHMVYSHHSESPDASTTQVAWPYP